MNNQLTARERKHVGRVKELECGVCNAAGPSQAHHVKQHAQFTVIPLCVDCHVGPVNGLHGQKRMWSLMKLDELDVLDNTIRKLYG